MKKDITVVLQECLAVTSCCFAQASYQRYALCHALLGRRDEHGMLPGITFATHAQGCVGGPNLCGTDLGCLTMLP